jgi:hypothetical protein
MTPALTGVPCARLPFATRCCYCSQLAYQFVTVPLPPTTDAGLMFIGRIRTPWTSRMETPRQGRADGPLCRIEVFEPWVPALAGLAQYERV